MTTETITVEKLFSHEAVTEYTNLATVGRPKGSISMAAKMHLSAVGWTIFWYKKNGRKDLRYQSPDGRVFNNLISACKWYSGEGQQISDQEAEIQQVSDQEAEIQHSMTAEIQHSMTAETVIVGKSFSPESVAKYTNFATIGRPKGSLSTAAKMHLSAVGWTFFWYEKNGRKDMRYQSPDGRVFNNLISACRWYSGEGQQVSDQEVEIRPPSPAKSRKPPTRKSAKKAVKKALKKVKSDYICSVCHDDGNLLLCDKCPSAFHAKCVGLDGIPEGDWYCPSCTCRICKIQEEDKDNHHHLQKCVQCLHRFHTDCLEKEGSFQNPKSEGIWFCSHKCEEINSGLKNLLGKRFPIAGEHSLEWRLYDGSSSDKDDVSKLKAAVSIIHDCFEPVVEPYDKRDTSEDAIFSRRSKLNRLNFEGFHTMTLERDDEVIIAALVRIHGERVAEMPLVATRFEHQRQGMCRILMSQLEKTLMELGVERLVLPAASTVLDTWVNKFGFVKVNESEKLHFLGNVFLDFYGTTFCQKILDSSNVNGSTISDTRNQVQKLLNETCSKKRKRSTKVMKKKNSKKKKKLACVSVC